MEWISVNDKLPENEEEVLVYDNWCSAHIVCFYKDGKWLETWMNTEIEDAVKYWMKLPEPPKE